VGGGYALYRAGYSQGYVASSLASGDADELVSPFGFPYPAPYMHPYPGFHPRFFGFGLFLLIGVVIMALVFRFFGFMAWRKYAGPDYEKWAKDWHHYRGRGWHWGPPGPWGPPGERAEPDAEEDDESASES
jgi:hypothetical protein